MSAPLEVTVVSSYGLRGGAERWLLDLLDATDRLRVDAVLLGDGPLAGDLDRRGIRHRLVATGPRPTDLARPTLALARHLAARRPDVVLANGVKAALVAGVAGRLTGVRVVWAGHDHSFDGRVSDVLARLVDAAVTTSPELAAATGHRWVEVVPPPRPATPTAGRDEARRALGVPVDGPLLGMVGRLTRYKGCEDAVRALVGTSWRLVLVGPDETGEERARLTGLAETLGVADRVTLTGPVDDARRLVAAFDALAVLTRAAGDGPDREGFGLAALEAMVAGVPVVAAGHVPALGGTGVVVEPGDVRAIATALERIADEGPQIAEKARAVAAEHPDAAACADALARLLAAVARRPGAGRPGALPLSVVTTVRDEVGAVDALVTTLRAQLRVPGDEVVVADGGSTDGTASLLERHAAEDPRVRVLAAPGAGISAGRNVAIGAAANERIVATDAGCHPVAGWLEAFRAAAEDGSAAREYAELHALNASDGASLAKAETEPALLTGVYRVGARTPVEAAFAAVGYPDPDELRRPTPLARAYGALLGRSFDAARPTGRSVSVTRTAWSAVGGFPEHLATGEDVLFGQAVAARAGAALVADAEVTWDQRASIAATARMYVAYGRGSGHSRDPKMLGRDLLRAAVYPAGLLLAARGGRVGRALVGAGAAAYLSLPVRRALRHGPRAVAAVPAAAAVRDLAKAYGAIVGLTEYPT